MVGFDLESLWTNNIEIAKNKLNFTMVNNWWRHMLRHSGIFHSPAYTVEINIIGELPVTEQSQ